MTDPKIADNQPKLMKMKPGTYYWCSCGKSDNQPFCDGSHAGSEFNPIPIKIEQEKEVWWCMCKHSNNKPFCDGFHKSLK